MRAIVSLGLKGAVVVAGFVMQLVLARTLGAEGLGVYATFLALGTVLSITGGFGMPMAAVRFLPVYASAQAGERFRGFLHRATRATAISSTVVMAGFCAVFLALPALRHQVPEALAAAPLILLLALGALANGVLQAMGQPMLPDLLLNFARSILVSLFILIFHTLHEVGPATALWLTGLAAALTWYATMRAADRALPVPRTGDRNEADRRAWLAAGFSFVATMVVASLIEQLDTIMLSALVGTEAAGIYSVASRLALMVGLATASVGALVAPALARQAASGDRAGLQRSATLAVGLAAALATLLALALAAVAPWLLPAFGPGFDGAMTPLAILLVGQVGLATAGLPGGMLALAGRNRAMVAVAVCAVILDIVLCLLLVPAYGAVGAAVATAATLICQSITLAVVAWRTLGVDSTLPGAIRLTWAQRRAVRTGPAPGTGGE